MNMTFVGWNKLFDIKGEFYSSFLWLFKMFRCINYTKNNKRILKMTYISIDGCRLALTTKELDEKVNQKMIDVNLIDKDFEGYIDLCEDDKNALSYLVKAAKIFNDVFLKQDHEKNIFYRDVLKNNAHKNDDYSNAYKLFNSLNGVEGLDGISEEPVEIFEGAKGAKGRNFYPSDLSVKRFHEILITMLKAGKVEEVKNILSNRSMVEYVSGELIGIDYTQYFNEEFTQIAEYIEKAAELVSNNDFSNYLYAQSKALLFKNEEFDCEADMIWANMQDIDLEFTISRENYTDEMTGTVFENEKLSKLLKENNIEVNGKDDFGVRVGIVNKKGTELILEFKKHMADIANLMPLTDKYEQKISEADEVKQTMVDVDLVYLSGDYAAARGGLTIAQNLPNDDKLSIVRGGGRRNVYHRQVRQTSDVVRTNKMLSALVNEDKHKYHNIEADHIFVIGHENGHSLGPDLSFKSHLGNYSHTIEECKADIISIAYMPYYRGKRCN